ncbi:DUF262 domain-containing protein [Methylotenera mobilis]|uniref:GmrSD restriction endonucleases N-terminal domain-containing protein n=1 Tax=Methylotenera mobilis (strain JLW8 / ATCC BAA-1282 / DSM 17540) TaxID=583345 RepID=C6WTZ4_METML|nr:DUF262 domain-containing protein [Methylotenera mobilis]ACT47393.1 protein of unknown function DUF262 [Methylotenera mobilis JLW8]
MTISFNDVLLDIKDFLIGHELRSINPALAPIFLTSIDVENSKYYVSSTSNTLGKSRPLSELREIWVDLERKGFTNVDQALYGGGSSRNQPETILANLPYIQFFKFRNKKHLLLRQKHVHAPGFLQEVEGSEYRKVRKLIENYLDLRLSEIVNEQQDLIQKTKYSLDLITKKYPAESSVQNIEEIIKNWSLFNSSLSESIVNIDTNVKLAWKPTEDGKHTDFKEFTDTPDFIGFEDGDQSKADITLDEDDKASDQLPLTASSNLFALRIRQLTPVISLIFDRMKFGDIDLQPDFQRKDRIWDASRKAKLIESILMKLPLPVFYFAEKADGGWIVVDGLQRITTIYDFIEGNFSLDKLNFLKTHNDKFYKDLTRTEQRDIREYAITAYLIDHDSSDKNTDLIVELFHRINTYGMKLSEQEIRSALKQGSSVRFLRYASSLDEFKVATRDKVKAVRQKDMELCLSALAFMVNGYSTFGNAGYDQFLKTAMSTMNQWGKFEINVNSLSDIEDGKAEVNLTKTAQKYLDHLDRFRKGLKLAYEVFEDYTFIRERFKNNTLINKQLFEIIVTYFSFADNTQREIILLKSANLIDALYTAIQSNSTDFAEWTSPTYKESNRGFNDAITQSTGKRVTVLYRFSAFRKILETSTGVDIDIRNLLADVNNSEHEH